MHSRDLQREIGQQIQAANREAAANRSAKITGRNEETGGYDVEFSDGTTMSSVGSITRDKWRAGDWVTLERTGSRWQIVGASVSAAG